jgi:thiol:disulfide interchange protein DsbD
LFSLLAAAFVAVSAWAFDPEKDVSLAVKQGTLVVQIPAKVHLKKTFMEVALAPGQKGKVSFGKLPPATGKDELGDAVWHGTQRFPLVAEGVSGTVKLVVTYQPCTEGEGGSCFPPTDRTLSVPASELPMTKGADKASDKAPDKAVEAPKVPEAAAAATAVTPVAAPAMKAELPAAPQSQSQGQGRTGLLLSLVLFFLGGISASLTPCVLPMIPITMAIIGARGASKGKGLLLGIVLTQGMAVTYTTLGVLAARSGGAFGAFAQKPGFLIPVSLIFALFALSLFGAFEIKLPDSLAAKLQSSGPRRGFLGAFVMGLILGPLSAPCVGPLIGTAILDIAAKGLVFEGALKMFLFAQGMGVLFIVGGVAVSALPKSGDWLIRFKQFLGLLVFGYAVWNLRLLLPEWTSFALWTVVLLVASGVFGAFEAAEGLVGGLRKGVALLCLALGLLLGLKAVETGLDLPLLPRGGAAAQAEAKPETWMSQDLEGALARAKAEKKLVLVDIYAEWCAQCKELDHKTWPAPEVEAWIRQNAVAVRIDTDKQRPDLAKKLEVRSYPSVILLDADGKELRRILGFQKPEQMRAWLEGR